MPPAHTSGECFDTPEDLPRLPFGTAIACAKSGGGKTTAVVNFIELMNFDRVFWIGHTIKSNKPLLDRLGKRLNKDDIFEDLDSPDVIDKLRKRVDQEAKELEQWEKEMKRFNTMMKVIQSPNAPSQPGDFELIFLTVRIF